MEDVVLILSLETNGRASEADPTTLFHFILRVRHPSRTGVEISLELGSFEFKVYCIWF